MWEMKRWGCSVYHFCLSVHLSRRIRPAPLGLQSLLPGWLGVNSHTILIQVHECLELQPQALSQASGVLIAATLILPLLAGYL